MNTKDVGFEKGVSKSGLEGCIEDAEANFGPLVKIAVAKGGTVATLNRDDDSPTKKAVVILDPEESAVCPSGKTQVCKGEAYISGVRQKVLICR
jgi:hypothetical protein